MIKKILLTFIISVFWALPLFAEQVDLIDKTEDFCIGKAVSTSDMLKCTDAARDDWGKEMNKYYNLLMKKLTAKQKNELIRTQKAWLVFRDDNAIFINSSIKNMQGTMYLNVASGEIRELVKQRAVQLRNYYKILSE